MTMSNPQVAQVNTLAYQSLTAMAVISAMAMIYPVVMAGIAGSGTTTIASQLAKDIEKMNKEEYPYRVDLQDRYGLVIATDYFTSKPRKNILMVYATDVDRIEASKRGDEFYSARRVARVVVTGPNNYYENWSLSDLLK